jgi:PhnB protein
MTAPTPYVLFPGTAREALNFYGDVFGCQVELHTVAEFGRDDGPKDAIAHGYLHAGPVALFAADVTSEQTPLRCEGLMLSLLGASGPPTLREWFRRLADGGRVVDDLQRRPWGAYDGQLIDRYGLCWLIGFESDDEQ